MGRANAISRTVHLELGVQEADQSMRLTTARIVALGVIGSQVLASDDPRLLIMELPGETSMLPVTAVLCEQGSEALYLSPQFFQDARREDYLLVAKVDAIELDRLKRLFATDTIYVQDRAAEKRMGAAQALRATAAGGARGALKAHRARGLAHGGCRHYSAGTRLG